jgi:cell division protein FtsZ
MKRRTFLRLTGALSALGLPWVTRAGQLQSAEDCVAHPPKGFDHQWPSDHEVWQGELQSTVIKVVGVGGAGGNAVEHMIREGCRGVDYICCNTDALALTRSSAPIKLQLGSGLGTGGDPQLGRELASLNRSRIAETLAGAHMVFITAGMGGGTGSGAAPVVAEVARGMGILTVAVVTKPFDFEGKRRRLGEDGAVELARHVDALIVLPNERLAQNLGDEISMQDAFKVSDNLVKAIITGIADMLNKPGLVGLDFEDVRFVIDERHGRAAVGSGTASGIDRARLAAEAAMTFPLMDMFDIGRECNVLVSMTGSSSLGLKDYKEVMGAIRRITAPESCVLAGAVWDDALGDELRVTVVAFGISERA